MALSADAKRLLRARTRQALKVANSEVIYAGSYAALRSSSHATTASWGYADVLTAAAGNIPMGGFFNVGQTGDTSATVPPEGEIDVTPQVVKQVSVAGGTGDITDLGQLVYMSDDDTFTFTRPTLGLPLGVAVRYHTGTTYDVALFSFGELCAIALGGAGQQLLYVGSYDLTAHTEVGSGGTPVNLRTSFPMPYHGKITATFAMIDVVLAGIATGETENIQFEIGGTDVTGGVIGLQIGQAKGAKVAGSSVTGNNVFHEGDSLDVEIVGGQSAASTNITAGRVDVYLEVQPLLGL